MKIEDSFNKAEDAIEKFFRRNKPEVAPPPGISPILVPHVQLANLRATLWMIRVCEGTDDFDGYRALYGHTKNHPKLFTSFNDHPRVRTYEKNDEFIKNGKPDYTTAAGAYQITETTYDALAKRLKITGFGPEIQDMLASELIQEKGAYNDVCSGNVQATIDKTWTVWASLPSSKYDQPKRTFSFAKLAFINGGGAIA